MKCCNETWALASKIAAKSGKTLRIGKEAFYRQLEMSEPEAYVLTSEVMAKNLRIDDAREGLWSLFGDSHNCRWRIVFHSGL